MPIATRSILRLPVLATSFAVLMSVSNPAFSGDRCESPSDSDLSACLTSTNFELKNIYESLYSSSDEYDRDALRSEERSWVAQRNKKCNLVQDKDFFASEDWVWSIVDNNELIRLSKSRCIVNLTFQRVAKLAPQVKIRQAAIEKLLIVHAQREDTPYQPPYIPAKGRTILDFIPRGYAILEKIEADFNGDQKNDVALILNTVPAYHLNQKPFLIIFATPAGDYALSVRNDHIAPTGEGGGIANPYGTDALKSKGRSVLIEESGGGSSSLSGHIDEYSYLAGDWYQTAIEEWSSIRDMRDVLTSSDEWAIYKTSTNTDLVSGKITITESWLNVKTEESREEIKQGNNISPEPLLRLGDIQQ